MDTIVRNVKDIDTSVRRALEHVIGQDLAQHQQLVIQVVDVELPHCAPGDSASAAGTLPDWCNVYQGLTDEAATTGPRRRKLSPSEGSGDLDRASR